MDAFTEEPIETDINSIQKYHLDHFREINLGRDAFDRLKHLKKSKSDLLKPNVKITFNGDFNLGLTEDQINLRNTSATQKFGLAN